MILLDTNVLSELMKANPADQVLAWVDAQPATELFISTITVAEILYGISRMPDGKRREQLSKAAEQMFKGEFAGRLLSFDYEAAGFYAALVSYRESIGRPISTEDAQIAAICIAHDAMLATRNVRDFEECTLDVINPWG
jgi:predicted nucleic acid-binding protein